MRPCNFPPFAPALAGAGDRGVFLPRLLGIVGGVFAASLLMAFAILGFAVLHAITRGLNSRAFALSGIYVASSFSSGRCW